MPLLASLYVLYGSVCAVISVHDLVKRREAVWYTALDFIADFLRLLLFVCFWVSELFVLIAPVMPYLFLFSWLWAIGWSAYEFPHFLQSLKSEAERQLFKRFGFGLVWVLHFPAFWFGGAATLRALR